MHKNVNLNQFSIIHDQKKIIGKDNPSTVPPMKTDVWEKGGLSVAVRWVGHTKNTNLL